MDPTRVKFLIAGAGPTGLGAGYRLRELGVDSFLIVDPAERVGGLSRSFRDAAGFTWDLGGHVQFSHYRYFDLLMERALGKDGWNWLERESWVWLLGRFVPYPFQNNLRHLPDHELLECLSGLVRLYRDGAPEPVNFAEWIDATFGGGIARVFMRPYNLKVWAYPLEELTYQWIGERVAVADLEHAIANVILKKDERSWGPNNRFGFPKAGGTGAIWESVADLVGRDGIRLGVGVAELKAHERTAVLSTGETVAYEALLSTMPLDRLVSSLSEFPQTLRDDASLLKFSSSNIVGVGLRGRPAPGLATKCWMYFPEGDCPFYRVTVFSNYAGANVPDPSVHWSLMAEVAESPFKPVHQDSLVDDVIAGLRSTRLLQAADQIVSRWSHRCHHGYPTPFLGRDAVLGRLHAGLEPLGIFSRGRFGGWKYEVSNQDHSLMQGVEWANRMVLAVPEVTYPYPATANAGWGRKL